MDILQTYETTISSDSGTYSLTALVIPARTYGHLAPNGFSLHEVGEYLFEGKVEEIGRTHQIPMDRFVAMLASRQHDGPYPSDELLLFANYAATARIIPFEQSPLGADSLASIATSSVKAGTITLGATVGFLSAGPTPFLPITVPLGIVLCGASVSFAKWLEENRKPIWNRLLPPSPKRDQIPDRPRRRITFEDE
jgi:hypothetical protein